MHKSYLSHRLSFVLMVEDKFLFQPCRGVSLYDLAAAYHHFRRAHNVERVTAEKNKVSVKPYLYRTYTVSNACYLRRRAGDIEPLARAGRELLGVVQAVDGPRRIQDHRACHSRHR